MPTSLTACAKLLSAAGLRHHVDTEDAAIRVVFVTRYYRNPRDEKLAIVRIETPDAGRRVRAAIVRAFSCGGNPAATCLTLCQLLAATPLVSVAYDARGNDLRLVVEAAVEDGRLTTSQLCAMLDGLIEAAEALHVATRRDRSSLRQRSARSDGHAA